VSARGKERSAIPTSPHMPKLRVLYVAGPGNVMGTYRCWARGEGDPASPDVAYSQLFFELSRELGFEAWVIASHVQAGKLEEGALRVEHRPVRFESYSGLVFHCGRVLHTLGVLFSAIRYRARLLVVNGHGVHWFLLRIARWFGIRVVPTLHGTLWSPGIRHSRFDRAMLVLARPLFSSGCLAILGHPGACERQVEELTRGRHPPYQRFISYYRKTGLLGVREHGDPRPPFRVLFVGRIEQVKGVFDLLAVARELDARKRLDIEFDLCGDGSQLERLRQSASEQGLAARFRCHGRLAGAELHAMFGRSHLVVVPTRPEIEEGFNAVIAEAILAGRPVVTSRACPALELVREAALEVPPGDVPAYRDAILQLCDDAAAYESRRLACAHLKTQFLDYERSWGAALRRVIESLSGRPAP